MSTRSTTPSPAWSSSASQTTNSACGSGEPSRASTTRYSGASKPLAGERRRKQREPLAAGSGLRHRRTRSGLAGDYRQPSGARQERVAARPVAVGRPGAGCGAPRCAPKSSSKRSYLATLTGDVAAPRGWRCSPPRLAAPRRAACHCTSRSRGTPSRARSAARVSVCARKASPMRAMATSSRVRRRLLLCKEAGVSGRAPGRRPDRGTLRGRGSRSPGRTTRESRPGHGRCDDGATVA